MVVRHSPTERLMDLVTNMRMDHIHRDPGITVSDVMLTQVDIYCFAYWYCVHNYIVLSGNILANVLTKLLSFRCFRLER